MARPPTAHTSERAGWALTMPPPPPEEVERVEAFEERVTLYKEQYKNNLERLRGSTSLRLVP